MYFEEFSSKEKEKTGDHIIIIPLNENLTIENDSYHIRLSRKLRKRK
jgi:hypothetical protein